jgi:hypothetical protein
MPGNMEKSENQQTACFIQLEIPHHPIHFRVFPVFMLYSCSKAAFKVNFEGMKLIMASCSSHNRAFAEICCSLCACLRWIIAKPPEIIKLMKTKQ